MKRYALVALVAVLASACGKKESPTPAPAKEDLRAQYVGYWGRSDLHGRHYEDLVQISPEFKAYRHLSPASYDTVMKSQLGKIADQVKRSRLESGVSGVKDSWTTELGTLEVSGNEVSLKVEDISVTAAPIELRGESKTPCTVVTSEDLTTKFKTKADYCKLTEEDYVRLLLAELNARQVEFLQLAKKQISKAGAVVNETAAVVGEQVTSVLSAAKQGAQALFMKAGDLSTDVKPEPVKEQAEPGKEQAEDCGDEAMCNPTTSPVDGPVVVEEAAAAPAEVVEAPAQAAAAPAPEAPPAAPAPAQQKKLSPEQLRMILDIFTPIW